MQFVWSETNLGCSSSIVVSLEAISDSVSVGIGIVAIGSLVGISLGSRTIFKSQHKILPQHSFCHGGAHHVHVHSVHIRIHVHFQRSMHQPGLSIVIQIPAQNFTSAFLLPWWCTPWPCPLCPWWCPWCPKSNMVYFHSSDF